MAQVAQGQGPEFKPWNHQKLFLFNFLKIFFLFSTYRGRDQESFLVKKR
jgi:hypothetical protein